MSPLRFGIVGCGAIHGTHAQALAEVEGAELVAVCDEVEDRAQKAAETFGVAAFTRLEDLLAEVDAITVCVPSGLHHQVGIQAARAGKHVLTEKPVDITHAHALQLVEACEAAGVKNGCISQHRFAPDIQRTREAVRCGELGNVFQGDAYIKWYRSQAYYDSGDWRGTWALDGGGCLMNQGVHYVDMIQWIMGGVSAVRAITRTATHQIEVEDVACALIEYQSGAVGVIQGSTSVFPGLAERVEVHGSHGTVIVEGDRIKVWEVDEDGAGAGLYGRGVNQQPTPKVEVVGESEEGAASDPAALWVSQHRLQIQDFVDAIRFDRAPMLTCREAMNPLTVILAIYESARRGGERVTMEEIR